MNYFNAAFLSFESEEQSYNSKASKQHAVSFIWIAFGLTPLLFIILFHKLFDEIKHKHIFNNLDVHIISVVHDLPAHFY